MRTLVTGGIKSGKSSFALTLAKSFPGKKYFIATATPFDDEMKTRILRHKKERGNIFQTIEEPIQIDSKLKGSILLDCLTMWMNNLFFEQRQEEWERILTSFLEHLPENAVIVTNEVGLGNIPPDPASRKYNEYLAAANKLTARIVDTVVMMVAGIPLYIKSPSSPETAEMGIPV